MSVSRPGPIPLPCALLALSVAMCIGAAGPVEASTHRGTTQADQRETLEHLLGAIQQAAKKLSDQLTGQAVAFDRPSDAPAASSCVSRPRSAGDLVPAVLFLREALLNLPPPTC